MRNIILILSLIIFYSTLKSQCPSFVTFYNQSDIDAFLIEYAHCHKINRVIITKDIHDISGLINQLDTILHIGIDRSKVKNITLSNVFYKQIDIGHNDSLEYISLTANFDVESIAINTNKILKTITSDLKFVGQYNIISDTLKEFEVTFENISENLMINNFYLANGIKFLNNPFKVKKECFLWFNGIKSFKEVSPYIDLDSLALLSINYHDVFDFETIDQISKIRAIYINQIKDLDLDGFESSSIPISQLSISNCPNLKTLMPFRNCEINSLDIYENDALMSLDGIVFKDKKAQLRLQFNDQLQDIDIVENIDTFTGNHPDYSIQITDNPLLETCVYDVICKTLIHPRDSMRISISGNLNECENKESIIEACLVNNDEIETKHSYTFNQNEFKIVGFENKSYRIFDLQGKILDKGKYVDFIKMDKFPSGIYLIKFIDAQKKNIFRVIKY